MRTEIRDFSNRIIGYIDTYPNGDKELRNFYNEILGRYDKQTDTTRDFHNVIVARGDSLTMLLKP